MEKTPLIPQRHIVRQKHLHERGEDSRSVQLARMGLETPPRAWRRRKCFIYAVFGIGNTSTSVEKTIITEFVKIVKEKHLHERGEDNFKDGSYKH